MLFRVILTIVLFIVWGLLNTVFRSTGTIISGRVAGMQFENSDTAAVFSQTVMTYTTDFRLSTGILVILLLIIWWNPLRWLFTSHAVIGLIAGSATMVAGMSSALAYYDKTDYTEAYTILPNESAFWIPDTGANKDSQGQYDSEAYLQANRVALKRFIVPHTKLQGSGSWFDFYIPAGRLIIVDRTPFSREWVAQAHRGSSNKDESFPCQTKEGLNASAGVSIGASVMETNAAKYLYRFGVLSPVGDRGDPKTIFNSVYYSRKLSDVMDDVGRKKVQTLVCDQFASRTMDEANAQSVAMMTAIKTASTEYFGAVGVTLDFIGWADTFTFDKDVQAAINRAYIAQVDKANAALLQPYAATIQALAAAEALRSFGEHTDGKLPTTIVGLPTDIGGLLSGLLRTATPPTAAPATTH